MNQNFDVISIGSATIDIFVKSKDFIYDKNFLSLRSSSKNEINEGLICSGGGATNSSVAFSRLGLKSACVSLIGNSYLNNYIYDDLQKNQVSEKFVCIDKSDVTDYSVILVGTKACKHGRCRTAGRGVLHVSLQCNKGVL